MRWQSSRSIQAPSDRVFRTVADPEEFQKAMLGRIMNRLIAGMVQRALDQDLDSVKAHCEK